MAPGGSGGEEKVGEEGKGREMKALVVAIDRMQRLYVIEVTRYLRMLGEYGTAARQVHSFPDGQESRNLAQQAFRP
jgi:hypothetical protein